ERLPQDGHDQRNTGDDGKSVQHAVLTRKLRFLESRKQLSLSNGFAWSRLGNSDENAASCFYRPSLPGADAFRIAGAHRFPAVAATRPGGSGGAGRHGTDALRPGLVAGTGRMRGRGHTLV